MEGAWAGFGSSCLSWAEQWWLLAAVMTYLVPLCFNNALNGRASWTLSQSRCLPLLRTNRMVQSLSKVHFLRHKVWLEASLDAIAQVCLVSIVLDQNALTCSDSYIVVSIFVCLHWYRTFKIELLSLVRDRSNDTWNFLVGGIVLRISSMIVCFPSFLEWISFISGSWQTLQRWGWWIKTSILHSDKGQVRQINLLWQFATPAWFVFCVNQAEVLTTCDVQLV